jgi:hypothetical protein
MLEILPHQLEAIKFLKEKSYIILADNMGLSGNLDLPLKPLGMPLN